MQHDHWTKHHKRDHVALDKSENESRIILPGHGGNDDVNVFITSRLKMRIILNAIWLQQCSECIFLCELTKLWQFLMLMRRQSTADDEKFTVRRFTLQLGKASKKNWEKAVRLTAWVDPPSPPPKRSGKCENFSTSCHI